jgi:hypothetical protein
MARIRTIKPEFFTSEDIVSLTPLARVFYIALWCEADRAGRLDWKPGTLKMRYLPGDNCDINTLAQELIDAGLIALYEVDGKRYAEIPTFTTHQVINNRESESARPSRNFDASSRVKAEGKEGREGKGKEEEGKEGEAPRKRSAPTPAIPQPDDVDQQTWADWLSLRKAKKAPVTETVVNGARDESAKAGMTLDAFLQVWCLRGSQGLQADWLRPDERRTVSRVQPMSFAQQDAAEKRARWEQMTGRKWPEDGAPADFIDVQATQKSETLLVEQQGL